MKLKWVGRAVSKGQSGSSRRRRGNTVLGDGNDEGTAVSVHSHSGNWNRKIQKRRARWRRSEASNRRSILSKRKREPDLLTPPASSLFHWSLRRRNREVAASNREVAASKSQSTSVRFRSCTQASFLSKSSANRPNLVKVPSSTRRWNG